MKFVVKDQDPKDVVVSLSLKTHVCGDVVLVMGSLPNGRSNVLCSFGSGTMNTPTLDQGFAKDAGIKTDSLGCIAID